MKIKIFHSCCTRVVRVALESQLCCSCLTRVALVSHSFRTCVVLVSLVSGTHVVKQTRSLRPATLLKKRLWHSCFPVNFAKFPKTPFLQNNSGRLLLSVIGRKISFWGNRKRPTTYFRENTVDVRKDGKAHSD